MRRHIAALVVLAALASSPASASASRGPTLSKAHAWYTARNAARYLWLNTDGTTGYSVEPYTSCARQSRRTVDCDFQLYDESVDPTTVCDGTIRVRLTRRLRLTWDLLGDPTCA
jgi:hypothetical protein